MRIYEFQGVNADGSRVQGQIEAEMRAAAELLLRERGLIEFELRDLKRKSSDQTRVETLAEDAARQVAPERKAPGLFRAQQIARLRQVDQFFQVLMSVFRGRRIWTRDEKATWLRQFAELYRACSVAKALEVLAQDGSNPLLAKRTRRVLDQVVHGRESNSGSESGNQDTLTRALQEQGLFHHREIAILLAGASSGQLPERMEYLADGEEKSSLFLKQLTSHLVHPALVLCVIWLSLPVLGYAAGTVMESLAELHSDPNALFWASLLRSPVWMGFCWCCPPILLSLLVILAKKFDFSLWVRFPGLGGVIKDLRAAELLRTLSQLIGGGVRLQETFEILARMDERMNEVAKQVEEGVPLSQSFEGHLPPIAVQMMRVEEETGKFGTLLSVAAEILEEGVERKLEQAIRYLEPLLLLGVGLLVGGFCALCLSPILKVIDSL